MYLGSNSVYNKSKQTDEVGGEKNTDWTIPSLTELTEVFKTLYPGAVLAF